MKLTAIILFAAAMQVAARTEGQTVTLSVKNAPVKEVFKEIQKQTGLNILIDEALLAKTGRVTIEVKDAPVTEVLNICLKNMPLDYTIENNAIVVKEKSTISPEPVEVPPPIDIKGRITDEEGNPVPGATVTVKGTQNATATDANGYYTLKDVDENATLAITGANIESYEVKVNGKTVINATVKLSVKEEEIVVAYGTRTRTSNTGAVTVVKGKEIETLPNRSFDKSLQGLVPGLLVSPGSGLPGGGVGNFVLRGIATNAEPGNFSTVRNPLIIIDGVPVTQETSQIMFRNGSLDYNNAINNPLAQLNPSDIESITVLKDAAAIALYGAKSGNGVILVTTKRGKSGITRFGFRHQTDVAVSSSPYKMLNQSQYLNLLIEAYKNSDPGSYPDDASVIAELKTIFPTKTDGSFYPEVDWYNELYKDRAFTFSNEIFMSGGDEKTNFYLSLDYTNQDGIRKKTSFDRKSLRFNFEKRPANWLKLGLNSTVSHSVQDYGGSAYQNDLSSVGLAVLEFSPLNPIRLESGEYYNNFLQGGSVVGANFPNPVAQLDYNINKNTALRGLTRLYGEIEFLKNFKFLSSFGVDFMLSESKEKNDPRLVDVLIGDLGGRIEEQDNRTLNLISTNILRFDKQINNKNRINILVGQEAQILNRKILDIAVTGLTSPYYDQINSPGVTVFESNGFNIKETLLSYFSQLNYDFKSRYFLTASVRRDGSSRFGEDKRFGTYWSTGAGWLISAEPFMKAASSWLNYLKIRGSIGAAGNAGAIDRFTPYDRLLAGIYLGGTAVNPDGTTAGNADVKWENTFTWDAGLELRFLNDRIGFTADIYTRNTSNLIYALPLAYNTGYVNILGNIGKMNNSGVEFSINVDVIKNHNFSWTLNANWSTNKNKLTKISTTSPAVEYLTHNQEGESFNSFYLRRWAGVNPDNGSPQWIDSTGKPNSDYNATKPELVGKAQPDAFGSVTNTFKCNNFEFLVMLYYQYGYQVYNTNRFTNDGVFPYANQSIEALDRWQKPGDVVANPKRVLFDPSFNLFKRSTRYLFNGDHIRLQNILLSYNLNSRTLKSIGLNGVKVFIQGNNLKVWTTKRSNIDPAGNTASGSLEPFNYQLPKSFSIGLNANF